MTDLLARYADIVTGRSHDIASLIAAEAVFASPFSVWETPADVSAVYRARAAAVTSVVVTETLRVGDDVVVLLWQGCAGEQVVDGCEIVRFAGEDVVRVDLFLRPAAALASVLAAMREAWPRP